jgi:hypothetical protein
LLAANPAELKMKIEHDADLPAEPAPIADAIEKRIEAATKRTARLTQAILAKAFRGELVPTEAEVAAATIQEGNQAVKMTRLSCHRSRSNEMRLWLSVIAYNLGNLWRRLVLPQRIGNWSLTSLQQRLVKTGGRLIKHARYYWLLLAESHLTRRLFASMLGRIDGLPLPSG